MNYEKLHKEALNKLQQMVSNGKITEDVAKGICSDFVPESKDERIIREISEALSYGILHEESTLMPGATTTLKEALAYLEKQKQTKRVAKFKVGDIINFKGGIYAIIGVNTNNDIPFYSVRTLDMFKDTGNVVGIGAAGEDYMMKIGYIDG